MLSASSCKSHPARHCWQHSCLLNGRCLAMINWSLVFTLALASWRHQSWWASRLLSVIVTLVVIFTRVFYDRTITLHVPLFVLWYSSWVSFDSPDDASQGKECSKANQWQVNYASVVCVLPFLIVSPRIRNANEFIKVAFDERYAIELLELVDSCIHKCSK